VPNNYRFDGYEKALTILEEWSEPFAEPGYWEDDAGHLDPLEVLARAVGTHMPEEGSPAELMNRLMAHYPGMTIEDLFVVHQLTYFGRDAVLVYFRKMAGLTDERAGNLKEHNDGTDKASEDEHMVRMALEAQAGAQESDSPDA
jgi:hypothetical protein